MERENRDKKLDELISAAIGRDDVKFDFDKWKSEHAKEIREFCTQNFGVEFDMFAKIDVNGDSACDLYKHLTSLETKPTGPGKISWNFEKFLIGRDGQVIARFRPRTKPDSEEVVKAIETALAQK